MTQPRSVEELIAERTETVNSIQATIECLRYLVNLIVVLIKLDQQYSNTHSDSQHHTGANMLENNNHVLRQTAEELRTDTQAIIAASQETVARSRELRAQSQRIRADKANAILLQPLREIEYLVQKSDCLHDCD